MFKEPQRNGGNIWNAGQTNSVGLVGGWKGKLFGSSSLLSLRMLSIEKLDEATLALDRGSIAIAYQVSHSRVSASWFPKTNKSLRITTDWQPPVNELNTDRYHTAEPVISF